jgi:uncharacterized membrane protein YkoI
MSLALIGAAALTTVALSAQASSDDAYVLREAGDVLPFEQILERARAEVPGTMLEADLERKGDRHVYEVEMLSDDGRHRELYFDARTGELLKKE